MSEKIPYDDEESEISTCTGYTSLKRNLEVLDDEEGGGGGGGEEGGYLILGSDSESESESGSTFVMDNDDPKEEGLYTIREEDCESSVFSLDFRNWNDVVHVCVGKHGDKSSLEALSWTLKHCITPFTTLCLLHVFPLVRLIPSPMGKLPRSHVNKCYVDLYLDQHIRNRKLLLQGFIDLCLASQVKVETMLIEGDDVAKSIVDFINNKEVRKLVLGITKYNLRKSGSRRRKGIAEEVVKKAPEYCDVKIICEGRDVIYDIIGAASPCSSGSDTARSASSREDDGSHGLVASKNLLGPGISPPSR